MSDEATFAFEISRLFAFGFMFSAPAWSLVAFGAYVAGRRQYSLAILHLLLVVEAFAIVTSIAALHLFSEARE